MTAPLSIAARRVLRHLHGRGPVWVRSLGPWWPPARADLTRMNLVKLTVARPGDGRGQQRRVELTEAGCALAEQLGAQ